LEFQKVLSGDLLTKIIPHYKRIYENHASVDFMKGLTAKHQHQHQCQHLVFPTPLKAKLDGSARGDAKNAFRFILLPDGGKRLQEKG
jgi:hypothetical protein